MCLGGTSATACGIIFYQFRYKFKFSFNDILNVPQHKKSLFYIMPISFNYLTLLLRNPVFSSVSLV